jgi:hypothetical protein
MAGNVRSLVDRGRPLDWGNCWFACSSAPLETAARALGFWLRAMRPAPASSSASGAENVGKAMLMRLAAIAAIALALGVTVHTITRYLLR